MSAAALTSFRTCPLCEATCGLEVTTIGDRVTRIRGDRDDVFSHGYLCPKGSTLRQLHEDPDRIRRPLVRRGLGAAARWDEVGWDEAYAEIERRLGPVIETHGRDSVAVYLGNPNAHNLALMLYGRALLRGTGTARLFSASTVDQMPKQVAAGLMFGTAITVAVPDVDHTDHLVVIGANPFDSNGSLLTAPDLPGRLQALRARGGRLVVIDPRRTRTAEEADEHVALRPGTDALLLAAVAHTLFDEGLVELGPAGRWVSGVAELRPALDRFTPEAVAADCAVPAATIRRLARELAGAPRAAVYGRIGTCTQEFGTTASWLVDVLNTLTGNLDRRGGAMFPRPAAGSPNTEGTPGRGRGFRLAPGRTTRVRALPAVLGELPVAALAEEIDTPGDGRVRALISVAGNPVASTPHSERLDRALATLDCVVSVDLYRNETSRHAHVILPPPSPLAREHFDVLLYRLAVRNVANYSPPTLPLGPDERPEWEILLRLGALAAGEGTDIDVAHLDDRFLAGLVQHATATTGSPVEGLDPDTLVAELSRSGRRGPARIVDLLLRTGPFGDAFGSRPDGLRLDVLLEAPHGVDLGPLEPRLPEVLRTPSGTVELAPAALVDDLDRLASRLGGFAAHAAAGGLVLIGRRDLRSNNSWMHNVDVLVKGRPRCTLQVHPSDAARLGLLDGGPARVSSRVGALDAAVEVTDRVMAGVVSLPHGWGHDRPGSSMEVAARHAGVNSNILTDDQVVDPLSGNGVLSGIPVTVSPVGDRADPPAAAGAAATGAPR